MRKSIIVLLLPIVFVACATPQSTKPYAISKVTAETILYEARVLLNNGKITAQDFDVIKTSYDYLQKAQDAAIDARIAAIRIGTAEANQKWQVAWEQVLRLSNNLINLAKMFKIDLPGGV